MVQKETMINKKIEVDTIIKIADYLEFVKNEFAKLIKSKCINTSTYNQYTVQPRVNYSITFYDNKTITQTDYKWLVETLKKPEYITKINMTFYVSYKSQATHLNTSGYRKLRIYITLCEERIYHSISGNIVDTKINNISRKVCELLQSNGDRYDKTISFRNFITQCYCLSLGLILSYIVFALLILYRGMLPTVFDIILNNKYYMIIGHWLFAAVLGNICGYWFMRLLYIEIMPRTKSYYSWARRRRAYYDDVLEYVKHNEIQIGKYKNAKRNRTIINNIYKISKVILLLQLIASTIFCFVK